MTRSLPLSFPMLYVFVLIFAFWLFTETPPGKIKYLMHVTSRYPTTVWMDEWVCECLCEVSNNNEINNETRFKNRNTQRTMEDSMWRTCQCALSLMAYNPPSTEMRMRKFIDIVLVVSTSDGGSRYPFGPTVFTFTHSARLDPTQCSHICKNTKGATRYERERIVSLQ